MTAAPELGEVTGLIWFDRNLDTAPSAREWVLPAVPVVLTPVTNFGSLRMSAHAAAPFIRTATTDRSGAYRFTGVPAGRYVVTARLAAPGFGYTWNTGGRSDWRVAVSVAPGAPGRADFAGIGKGELAGHVVDTVHARAIARARVACTWAGFDDAFGTPDDVVMADAADDHGNYDWPGVPYGDFTCTGTDPQTSQVSPAAVLHVMSAAAVRATLPVGRTSVRAAAPPQQVAPAVSHDSAPTLPSTGTDVARLLLIGLSATVGGGLVVRTGRRRAT